MHVCLLICEHFILFPKCRRESWIFGWSPIGELETVLSPSQHRLCLSVLQPGLRDF